MNPKIQPSKHTTINHNIMYYNMLKYTVIWYNINITFAPAAQQGCLQPAISFPVSSLHAQGLGILWEGLIKAPLKVHRGYMGLVEIYGV